MRTDRDIRKNPSAERHPGRKLHKGHFAFMRAVVQGLDARDSWNRYLYLEGEYADLRAVRRTIQRIRDEFAAAARRFGRHGVARLVLLDADRVQERKADLPSLEDFALEHGLQDFSYAEQLEHYQQVYGKASQRQSRRSRLIDRQLEALHWLEGIAAVPPRADDPVFAWLNPEMAAHLERAGIRTLRQLCDRINGIGLRWWAGIRAIGRLKAERLMAWLRAYEDSHGLVLGVHVELPRSLLDEARLQQVVAPGTAIVPLEKLVIPPGLDGTQGRYRALPGYCRIDARSDREAVQAWVAGKQGAHTRRAYWKEAERLMLWAVIQRGKALSSLDAEDCRAYCAFLADPQPAAQWCGPRGREKWSPLWRPFEGPLSLGAQRQAITILKNLYKFLVQQGYLTASAWDGIELPEEPVPSRIVSQFLDDRQWQFLLQSAERLPDTSANLRLRMALHLMQATGLRISEAVAAKTADLVETPAGWQLRVAGQGGQARNIDLPPALLSRLSAYLQARGLPPVTEAPPDTCLLGKAVDIDKRAPWSKRAQEPVDPSEGITAGTLYEQLRRFFRVCADNAQDGQREILRKASARWLRHSYGIARAASSASLLALQREMGYASVRSAERYFASRRAVIRQ